MTENPNINPPAWLTAEQSEHLRQLEAQAANVVPMNRAQRRRAERQATKQKCRAAQARAGAVVSKQDEIAAYERGEPVSQVGGYHAWVLREHLEEAERYAANGDHEAAFSHLTLVLSAVLDHLTQEQAR